MGRSNNQRRALAKKTGTTFTPKPIKKSKRAKVALKARIEQSKTFNAKKNVGPIKSKRQIAKDRKARKK
ncbi:hypothetical protein DIPPA_23647 [Diplonema papillatum]|nr:hypothetical protein DIPPA_23647 [Diplonema papillatum]